MQNLFGKISKETIFNWNLLVKYLIEPSKQKLGQKGIFFLNHLAFDSLIP